MANLARNFLKIVIVIFNSKIVKVLEDILRVIKKTIQIVVGRLGLQLGARLLKQKEVELSKAATK